MKVFKNKTNIHYSVFFSCKKKDEEEEGKKKGGSNNDGYDSDENDRHNNELGEDSDYGTYGYIKPQGGLGGGVKGQGGTWGQPEALTNYGKNRNNRMDMMNNFGGGNRQQMQRAYRNTDY